MADELRSIAGIQEFRKTVAGTGLTVTNTYVNALADDHDIYRLKGNIVSFQEAADIYKSKVAGESGTPVDAPSRPVAAPTPPEPVVAKPRAMTRPASPTVVEEAEPAAPEAEEAAPEPPKRKFRLSDKPKQPARAAGGLIPSNEEDPVRPAGTAEKMAWWTVPIAGGVAALSYGLKGHYAAKAIEEGMSTSGICLYSPNACPEHFQSIKDAGEKADTFGTIANVSLGIGVTALVVGIYKWMDRHP